MLTNASGGSGTTFIIPDWALLYNDVSHGNNLTLNGPVTTNSANNVSYANHQFTFIDDATNGGSFQYTDTANNSLTDNGLVTVNRTQAGDGDWIRRCVNRW